MHVPRTTHSFRRGTKIRKPGSGGKRPGAGRPSTATYVARLAARLAGLTFVDPGMT
jgi:hypothetical protein